METSYERYAIYFAPKPDTELARFGRDWLGMDAGDNSFNEAPSPYVESPRRYGFHATLKAPMRLATGVAYSELYLAVEKLARKTPAADLGVLVPKRLGGFLALVCEPQMHEKVSTIAWQCVTMLDRFRAELNEYERNKRADLKKRQARNLHLWGYPYVGEDFRFHMTLTSALSKEELDLAEQKINHLLPEEKTIIDSICIFGDPGGSRPFALLERFDLQG